ncbi:MAG: amino acid permease [Bryobacterales bacterium]|nr:amino acid permease [Bryobacterales bacterium]
MNPQPVELRRDLGITAAVAIVVGTVIGSGIFLVPKTMILKVGSPDLLFLVWIVGGLLSLFGALTYAELAASMPEAGGEYVFLREAYGPFWGFLFGWIQTLIAKSGSIAALGVGFFLYFANFFPVLDSTIFEIPLPIGPGGGPLPIRWGQAGAACLILLLAGVNYLGVRISGGVQIFFTVSKLALIFGLVAAGLLLGSGSASHFTDTVPAPGGFTGFFAALVAALWAYDGWNNLSMVSSEIKRPGRNLPLALIAGTGTVMLVYLLTNLAYFYVLSPADVAASDRVASEMMRRILGDGGAAVVSVVAMVSMFAALNGSILSGSRIPYAMARDGLFPRWLAKVDPVHRVPRESVLFLSLLASILVFSGRYEEIITYVIFTSWILYAMTTAAVIVLRRKRPELVRPYRTLGYPVVPALFVVAASAILISTLFEAPRESMIGLSVIAIAWPFYRYWARRRTLRAQA